MIVWVRYANAAGGDNDTEFAFTGRCRLDVRRAGDRWAWGVVTMMQDRAVSAAVGDCATIEEAKATAIAIAAMGLDRV